MEISNVVGVVNMLSDLKGKHVKALLTQLERIGPLDPRVRKIVLDNFNNYVREAQRQLGYDVEQ